LVKRKRHGGTPEILLLPLRGSSVSGMYVCMYVYSKYASLPRFQNDVCWFKFRLIEELTYEIEELVGTAVSALGVRSLKLSNVLSDKS
jgi:hypothetical protein